MVRLPRLIIGGMSVRDYAYQWIEGACPLHQWCSGATGVEQKTIYHVFTLYTDAMKRAHGKPESSPEREDLYGLHALLFYLKEHKGHPAEHYIPDEWKPRLRFDSSRN